MRSTQKVPSYSSGSKLVPHLSHCGDQAVLLSRLSQQRVASQCTEFPSETFGKLMCAKKMQKKKLKNKIWINDHL